MAVSKKFSLGVIFASATLTIMAGSIIAPVLNLMRDGLGVAPASVGLIITTHGLFMALFSPLMGSVIDRKGARRPYIAALICYGLAGGSGLLINSFWVLLFSRACLGIALAGIFAGINVLILNMYDGIERDRVMGWRGSAQSFGGVIWPLIGGTLGGFFMALSLCRLHAGHTHRSARHCCRSGTGNPTPGQTGIQWQHIGIQGFSGEPRPFGHLRPYVLWQYPSLCHRHFSASAAGKLRHIQHISNRPVYYRHDGLGRSDCLHLRKDKVPVYLPGNCYHRCCPVGGGVYYHFPGIRQPDYRHGGGPVWCQPGADLAHRHGVDRGRRSAVLPGEIQFIPGNVRVHRSIPVPPFYLHRYSCWWASKVFFMVGAGVGAVWFLMLLFGLGRAHKVNSHKKGD